MRVVLAAAACLVTLPAVAQPAQPYAGLEARPVKALSQQQIQDLRAGRGMGLALPAELNGYPGPVHVLDLADQLALSDAQRARVRELYESMTAEAVPLGERLIGQETELDALFWSKTVTPANLAATTAAIGVTQATLRATHLKYHLSTLDALTPEQVATYNRLRGYGRGASPHGDRHHGPHGAGHRP